VRVLASGVVREELAGSRPAAADDMVERRIGASRAVACACGSAELSQR
jgi:hypothetical protein